MEDLIRDAQVIIRESRQNTIMGPAMILEKFLADYSIPVNPDYEEKDFYTYNVYPIINFIDVINMYNENVKEKIDGSACKPFIYNFIHNIYLGKFELAKFFNIFYPNNNHKFSFDTYTAPARLDKQLKMVYIHPKYLIEEILHKLCLLEYVDDHEDLIAKLDIKFLEWRSMDKLPNERSVSNNFNSTQINILSIISTLDAPIIRCFYDQYLPIIITDSVGLELIERTIKSTTAAYERRDNSSKSFFDNRIRNTIFRVGDKQVVKVFPLLDYEVVPLITDFANNKNAKVKHYDTKTSMTENKISMDCHPNVAIRLAFNEYITYNIVNADDIATSKLSLCLGLMKHYNITPIEINERLVAGVYHPFDLYIKEERVKSILHSIARKK
jgi:hypothetical protein